MTNSSSPALPPLRDTQRSGSTTAGHADRNRERTIDAARFTADDRDIKRRRRFASVRDKAASTQPTGHVSGRDQRHERELRQRRTSPRSRSAVAPSPSSRRRRLRIVREVHAFDHAIGLQHKQLSFAREAHDGAIIPWPENDRAGCAAAARVICCKQAIFADRQGTIRPIGDFATSLLQQFGERERGQRERIEERVHRHRRRGSSRSTRRRA